MAVNAAPSGPRWRFGAATMALATAFAVVACGSDADNSAAPARGRLAQRARGRVVGSTAAAARRRAVRRPEDGRGLHARAAGGRRHGRVPVPGDRSGPDQGGVPDRDPVHAGERRHRAPRHRVRGAAGRRCRGARAGREDPRPRLAVFRRDRRGRRRGGEERDATWVDTWAPGATETLLTQDVGFKLEPGSLLVLQIHYNLLATDGKPAGSDRSAVRLRLTDGTPQTRELVTLPLDAPTDLPCAADESGPLCDRAASIADVTKRFGPEVGGMADEQLEECGQSAPKPGDTQTCDHKVPAPMTLFAGFGHMHLLGRAIKVELNPGTPNAKVVLDVPQFDFDNQRLVKLPSPVEIGPGDTLRVTCTHDAGLRKLLPQLSKLPPRYVVWGDGTSDEMCTGIMTVSPRKS